MLPRCLRVSLIPVVIALLTVLPSVGQDKKPALKYMEVDLGGGVKMKLVRIEAGKFMMGSPKTEKERLDDEGPQHEVEITKPFYMGVYHVTQREYERVMGKNPSWFSSNSGGKQKVAGLDTSRLPVEQVSWANTVEFCDKLNRKQGKVFDLPTEAEWEYSCRAGSAGPFHYGNSVSSKQANFDGEKPYGGAAERLFLGRTTQVGTFHPNAFGLYDMHGNVWQWCKDSFEWDYYSESPARDPQGPRKGMGRVLRGGSYRVAARWCRSASRYQSAPDSAQDEFGFRVVVR